MCDNVVKYLSKYKHPHDKVACTNCEEALSACVTNKNLVPLVIRQFRQYYFRCGFYEIDMFVRMTIQALQHSDFNWKMILNHFYDHHRHRFRNLVFGRLVVTEEYKARMMMYLFIEDVIKVLNVSSAREA